MLENGLHSVYSDHYILQTKIQQELEKIDKDFARKFGFKKIKIPVKIRDIHKIKK